MRVRLITNCGRRKLNIELIEIDISQNGPERVVADLGIMCQGAVMVDKRAFVRDLSDMVHVLTDSQATTLIVDPTETGIKGASSAWQAVR